MVQVMMVTTINQSRKTKNYRVSVDVLDEIGLPFMLQPEFNISTTIGNRDDDYRHAVLTRRS